MLRIIVMMTLLIVFSMPSIVQATEKSTDTTSFTALLDRLRQHPEIQGYVSRAEASQFGASGELGLPDPMLFIQEQDYPIGSSMSRDQEQKMIGFKQVIPAFGTRGAKSERMVADSRKNKLLGDYAFSAMKAKLIAALANLERINKQEKLLDKQANLFGSEHASLKGRIAANQAGQSQLSLSEADSTDVQFMRADLSEEKHEIMAMISNMVGESSNVAPPPVQIKEWDESVEMTYPIMIASEDMAAAREDVDLREAEFNPGMEVQASYGRMNGGDNAATVMVGVTIPLWAVQSQMPKLNGAKSSLRAAEADLDNVRRQTLEKLSHLRAQINASDKKLEILQRKLSRLNASSGAQTREYEAGKTDLSMPLKTRRDMVSVQYQQAAEQAKRIALIADFNHYFIEGEKQ